MKQYEVVIIGGGVTGGMLARELSKLQLSVCLLEKDNDVAMHASHANSGIVHGGYDPVPGTLKAKMNTEGVEPLYEAARELNVPCIRNGSMVCAFSEEENKHLEMLLERGKQNNIPGLKILTGDEARAIEPNLSEKITAALHVTNAGIVSPYELTVAAIGNAMDNGVELLRNFRVVKIEKDELFTVTAENGQQVQTKYLVNCAGGNSDQIAELAGDGFFTIKHRAGEYMLLDQLEGSRVGHTIFQVPSKEGKGILVSPTVHGNLLVGPTAVQVAEDENTETTPEGLAIVARLAAKSVPSVNFRQVITSFAGVRASEAHDDFIIKASDKVENLVHVAAIDSPGLTSCVAIARYTVDILKSLGMEAMEKENWDGTRPNTCAFQEMTDEEKDAYIQENPAFGKIVCRCETVSEGEILLAIRTNPKALDLDGVKRRTRSGMGRCQGGFCSPYIMKLIARENHIPMEEVTKFGGESWVLIGKL